MKMPKINKNILLVIALVVVAVAGYFIFMSGAEEETGTPLVAIESSSGSIIGQEIVVELNRLRALQNINRKDLFENAAFASLVDFTQVVVPQPVGRPNPFAPVGF